MNSRRPLHTKSSTDDDEVNQLLQAAHDELLLNLSVNSHTVSNSDLDPDLSRRFLALKSRPSSIPVSAPAPAQQPQSSAIPIERVQVPVDDELKEVLGDDLSARFAALRGSLPSNSSITRPAPSVDHAVVEVEQEDEVEKILRWAKDAARLDPSAPSDDEVDDDGDDDDDDDDSISEGESDVEKGNGKGKGKGKSRKQK